MDNLALPTWVIIVLLLLYNALAHSDISNLDILHNSRSEFVPDYGFVAYLIN